MTHGHDTIAAPATAAGGALCVIRVSGHDALQLCDRIFRGAKPLAQADGYTVHYGKILDGQRILDDVLATVFRAPRSYTGEDSVEFSCHGSQYILSEVLRLLIDAGARMAEPGEFTIRAYLAGKLDLSQAEAVADMIASSSQAAHALASTQMRGGYSSTLGILRDKLLQITSLLELELDFSEEDVEFADRNELRVTMEQIGSEIEKLRSTFSLGNAIKEGVPVAIVGAPNVGKSTLLNCLLGEERAMVSDIAGTTRDVIEEKINIDGVVFRFIDTAGIRDTSDRLEQMGIERTMASIDRAQIVIHMTDATAEGSTVSPSPTASTTSAHAASGFSQNPAEAPAAAPATVKSNLTSETASATPLLPPADFTLRSDQTLLKVINKIDCIEQSTLPTDAIGISAKNHLGIDQLRDALRTSIDTENLYHGDAVVSHNRHYEALTSAGNALRNAQQALDESLPTDLLSEDIRQVIHHIGSITGEITSDDILKNIFSAFCIGK